MGLKVEFQAHEIDEISYALTRLGGHYNRLAKEDLENGQVSSAQLNRVKADEVFRIVANLPSVTDYADEIASHEVELAMKAWPGFLSC